MRDFMRVFGQGLIVEILSCFGVKREVELIFPAELETSARERVITELRGGMPFGQISRMGASL